MIAPGLSMDGLASAFTAPMYALPIDIFRVLAGLVSLWYFTRTLRQTSDFSSPDGLIDHRLSHRLLPPTRLSFFHPGIPAWAFRVVFTLACIGAVCITVGYQVKLAAAFLFLVAVSTYRWNFLVVYVDDAIMHIVLFWLILLPVGQTLTLQGWLEGGSAAFEAWASTTVPGGAVRCFLANLAIAYFVAGAYKYTSPMWRDGSALYAILKLPVAFTPDFWQPRHIPLTRLATYGALIIEPFLALMFVLPASSVAKWFIVISAVGFHLGIIATLKIPFANFSMLGAIPIVLHDEIMRGVFERPDPRAIGAGGLGVADVVALVLVSAIVLMLLFELYFDGRRTSPPLWKTTVLGFRRNPMCIALWCVGIAQSYRLFDWIDIRNYHVSYEAFENVPGAPARVIDPREIFPRSTRHILLQSYLHGSIWHQIDTAGLQELRRSILGRYARRYARRHIDTGTIEIFAIRQRITSNNLTLQRGVRRLLMRFRCAGGEPVIEYVSVTPEVGSGPPAEITGIERVVSIAPPAGVR